MWLIWNKTTYRFEPWFDAGKSHRDPKGEFKLETVQEYAKNREAGNKKTDLSDVSSLQQEYAKFGGKNPEFLESLA